jgi:hypothetical protein
MQITIHLTQEELKTTSLNESTLTKIILKKIGSISKNEQKIFGEVEIHVELKVDDMRQFYMQKKNILKN